MPLSGSLGDTAEESPVGEAIEDPASEEEGWLEEWAWVTLWAWERALSSPMALAMGDRGSSFTVP